MRKREVAKAIEARLKASAMSADEVLMRLADQGRGDLGEFSNVNFREDLEAHPKSHLVKKLTVITDETPSGGIKHRLHIELYDAQAALDKLARAYGLFNKDNEIEMKITLDVSGNITKALEAAYGDDNDDSDEGTK